MSFRPPEQESLKLSTQELIMVHGYLVASRKGRCSLIPSIQHDQLGLLTEDLISPVARMGPGHLHSPLS